MLKIKSTDFFEFISHLAWDELGRPLPSTTGESVVNTLEAIAKYRGELHELSIRTAWYKDSLWYDLGNKVVRIDEDGWKVVKKPKPLFRRFSSQKPQVEPIHGGSMKDVLNYLNVPGSGKEREETSILVLTYLVSVLIPDIPRPIIAIHGLPGAAKSTFFRIIKNLIDPSLLETMTYPRNPNEMIQMFSHNYMILLDNLSELTDWQSDELCKAVTGQSFSKRMLYTDDDDFIYSYKRAIGLNGINLVATKSDLLDRSLIFELQPIPKDRRKSEESFWVNFEKDKPKLLGAIFSTLSKAMSLKNQGLVKLEKKPRLADYAVWASAASLAMGHTIEHYLDAFEKNIDKQNSEAIDSSPIAQVIIDYIYFYKFGVERRESSKRLFEELKERAKNLGLDKDRDFPKTQGWLWRKIKPIKGNLQNIGIEVEYFDNVRPREILIKRTGKNEENDGDGVGDGETKPLIVFGDDSTTGKTPSSDISYTDTPSKDSNG